LPSGICELICAARFGESREPRAAWREAEEAGGAHDHATILSFESKEEEEAFAQTERQAHASPMGCFRVTTEPVTSRDIATVVMKAGVALTMPSCL